MRRIACLAAALMLLLCSCAKRPAEPAFSAPTPAPAAKTQESPKPEPTLQMPEPSETAAPAESEPPTSEQNAELILLDSGEHIALPRHLNFSEEQNNVGVVASEAIGRMRIVIDGKEYDLAFEDNTEMYVLIQDGEQAYDLIGESLFELIMEATGMSKGQLKAYLNPY